MLRKVCLRTGRQRHRSRARPSPHANTSRRPLRAVLLRKVSIVTFTMNTSFFIAVIATRGSHEKLSFWYYYK